MANFCSILTNEIAHCEKDARFPDFGSLKINIRDQVGIDETSKN